jgi:hypothetical protein
LTIPNFLAILQLFRFDHYGKNPDNPLFVKVPAFVRLGSFLANAFPKRRRAGRDAVLLFLRAALGAYPGGNTRLSPKTGAYGISVTGQVLGT